MLDTVSRVGNVGSLGSIERRQLNICLSVCTFACFSEDDAQEDRVRQLFSKIRNVRTIVQQSVKQTLFKETVLYRKI